MSGSEASVCNNEDTVLDDCMVFSNSVASMIRNQQYFHFAEIYD